MPGLVPSSRLGKPGRRLLKPARGCGCIAERITELSVAFPSSGWHNADPFNPAGECTLSGETRLYGQADRYAPSETDDCDFFVYEENPDFGSVVDASWRYVSARVRQFVSSWEVNVTIYVGGSWPSFAAAITNFRATGSGQVPVGSSIVVDFLSYSCGFSCADCVMDGTPQPVEVIINPP